MKVVLVGPSETFRLYGSWLVEEFSAEIRLMDRVADLVPALAGSTWDLLIVDDDCDGISIEDIVRSAKVVQPALPIVTLCGDAPQEAIEIMRLGISDYLVKPVEKESLLGSAREVLGLAVKDTPGPVAETEKDPVESPHDAEPPPDGLIFEGSDKMEAIREVVDKILDVDLPVLISGESGTGKEIVAQYICSRSKRNGPMVKVNCAAIPSELLESELFGYERGAFTGAYRRKPGKFEAAAGGFLFLDEISELPYPLQSKLLHVLQDGTVSTLGSTREVQVDVRIIAATNQDLEECVQRGAFRDDLFFRLNVVHINIPPLRERVKQLEVLVGYFREKFARQYNAQPVQLDDDAKSFLSSYRWPGNIRELENTIRRATVLGGKNLLGNIDRLEQVRTNVLPGNFNATGDSIGASPDSGEMGQENAHETADTAVSGRTGLDGELNLKEIAKEAALSAEREAIARVLQQTRWNRKKTAEILCVSYKTLLTKIKETGLDEN